MNLDRPGSRATPRPLLGVVALLVAVLLGACADLSTDAPPRPAAPTNPPVGQVSMVGAYVPSAVWKELTPVLELEQRTGRPFDIIHWFTSWDLAYDPVPVLDVLEHDRIPLITWQPHDHPVADIAAGLFDDYIRSWAQGVKTAPGLVYLRPFPEMNGNWVSWNGDPDNLRLAWRHMVQIFRSEGAHNVRWVFSPNVSDEPRTEANRMEHYYPGSDVVDILALDGYNWGDTRSYIGWRSFDDIFRTGYDRITTLGPQPLWIAEVASTEIGGDKGAWIEGMLDSTSFPRLEAIVWFNEDKETDWRLESSFASLRAFRDWFVSQAPGDGAAAGTDEPSTITVLAGTTPRTAP